MGAEDYLVKPFDPQELLIVVKSRIGRAQAIREASEIELDELKRRIITLEPRAPVHLCMPCMGYTELALEEGPRGDFQQFLVGNKRCRSSHEDGRGSVARSTPRVWGTPAPSSGAVEHELARLIRQRSATAEAGRIANRGVVLELDVPEDSFLP